MRLISLLIIGIFYSILCIFSIVTGFLYMKGKRKLNPLELSDSFVKKIKNLDKFARKMGLVTIIVGIAQGITAMAIFIVFFGLDKNWPFNPLFISLIFTIFSFCSVFTKLWNKYSRFALIKIICYSVILLVLLWCFIVK